MSKEAMKLALEHAKRDERHLNHAETRYWCRMYRDIAEKAIEALAEQPAQQQESVAWVCYGWSSDEKHIIDYEQHEIDAIPVGTLLYTFPQPSKPCEWQREDNIHMPDTWRSDCGVMWTFTDGGPVDNDMKYCCGCGAMLMEKKL